MASDKVRRLKLVVAIAVPLAVLCLPRSWIPIADLTVAEHRLLAIFALAVCFWVLEPVPIFATSVLVIMLQLLFLSDKGISALVGQTPDFGPVLEYQPILATFASPIIMLFLGGFFLALAATKYRLDVNLARVLLRPFGTRPKWVLLGLMAITAVFSMFMSNTACTAMMLALLTPVLGAFPAGDRGRTAFVLAIPFAANLGGLGTPIGTPPNAVAMKYLTGDNSISFGAWMAFSVPYMLVMLAVLWVLLLLFFKPQTERVVLEISGKFLKTPQAIIVYVTTAATILLWLFGSRLGLNSYVVAMIPVCVFTLTGIVTATDLRKMSWDVLWLVAGGIALGGALQKTGLSLHLVESVPFAAMPALLVIVASALVAMTMATFMSNTATANLVLPLVAALGASLDTLGPLGGDKALILVTTFSCSLAMALPVSTPPNAMAFATGAVDTGAMARVGVIVGLIGLAMTFVLLWGLRLVGFV